MIQWVLVPGGFHPDGTLRLSVFVAPRLMSDEDETVLERFPDFLDWPSSLATATFSVRTDEPRSTDHPATLVEPPPASALWRSLFGPRIPVRSHVPDDHGSNEVVSYPARRMSASVRAGYTATAAATPGELPLSETVPFDEDATVRFEDFHRRGVADEPVDSLEDLRAKVDFHQMLSALGDHPALLRRLGLVFELSVSAELIPPADADAAIRLTPTWQSLLPPGASTDIKPFTWYVHQPEIFVAAARGATGLGSLARGLIRLPEDQFSVEHVDLDGAVHKTRVMDPADASGFPALRTSGFSLVRNDRAAFLADDLALAGRREEELAQQRTIDLHADDLVRGHRLDVFDETTQRWFSLHERSVDYTVPGDLANSVQGVPAEGFFQVSLARPAGTDAGRLYVHERIITWDGWSLSGPRPGKALSEDPRSPDPGIPATLPKRVPNTAATMLPLEIEAAVRPGSLPRLRFGNGYRFRVRTVDLAGNGPTSADAPDLGPDYRLPRDGPILFHRFEAVPAPPLLPRARLAEGETVDRLVIRSTPGQSVAEYTAAFNQSPLVAENKHRPYPAGDERHLVAPKAALQLAEWHGMFDAAIGSPDPLARRRMYELARREKGSLDDLTLPGAEVVRVTRPDGTEVERYVMHTGETVAVPYLPDPLATGVVFHGLPGAETFQIPWDGPEWHEPRSFRLRIVDGDGPPHFDEAARVLTVPLPQGEVATVRVSSRATADPVVMGVLAWCREELPHGDFVKVLQAAEENRHWMITLGEWSRSSTPSSVPLSHRIWSCCRGLRVSVATRSSTCSARSRSAPRPPNGSTWLPSGGKPSTTPASASRTNARARHTCSGSPSRLPNSSRATPLPKKCPASSSAPR
jgi:hypothetical protein